jgi:polyisoprenoid-binding protein YceI
MKKVFVVIAAILAFSMPAFSQKFFTRDAKIQFSSETPLEKIEAVNKSASAVLDTKSGAIQWKVLIKSFLFEKALMQDHFNENYMESSKFPDATFKGTITNLSDINFAKDGKYTAHATGKMKIHGVERDIKTTGTITVAGTSIRINSDFAVAPADYNISIPSVVRDNIAKEIKVNVDGTLAPMSASGK